MSSHRKVLIIGGGPAGLTAALYAARANLAPLVIEGMQPGGQLTITTEVENFPGFPEGVQGPELIDHMHRQVEKFGTEFLMGTVQAADLSKRPFTLDVDGQTLTTETLIIATGATARLLGIPGENLLMGHGVSACATCDGFFFRGKEICVLGGGDSAMEEANFLTTFARKVTLIHRREGFRASPIMVEKVRRNPRIELLLNKIPLSFQGDPQQGGLEGVELRDTVSGETSVLKVDGAFVAIGHVPNTSLFKGVLDMDENGYLLCQGRTTATKVPGVFAAGDVADHRYRQAITAAGSGCAAALDAQHFLDMHS
ncbi:MAG: thioredoxin-disulfide reductase [bacterium]|jgi:thioredoxin reductase (NADPH)|nr:thioredoxin-disulfide reductase [bacterium]